MATLNGSWQTLGEATLYSSGSTNIKIVLSGILNSQSLDDNTSEVWLDLVSIGTSWRTSSGTASFTGDFTDSQSCATYPNYIYNGDVITRIKKTITHNNDGTKSINIGGVVTAYINGASRTATISNVTVEIPQIKRASIWSSSLISIPNIQNSFTLPITKYVSNYYDVVEVRNSNNTTLIKTINNATNGQSVTFTSGELTTIYTIDNNANQLPLRFYLDLKTYTDSNKTTQIGNTQRTTCEAFLVNSEPTAVTTVQEQDANVISLLGSSTSSKIIKNASDLLFTTTATALNGATISSVKVNDASATLDSGSYKLNITNITTGTFNIVTTDSRGLTRTEIITKTALDYIQVNINSNWEVQRASQVSSDLVLDAVIDCYSSTIDGNTNTPTVQYSLDNENWTTISSSSYTFTDNKITISNLTLSNLISYQNYGTFYLRCTDLLSSHQDSRPIAKGIETFSYGENDFQINGDLIVANEDGNNETNILKSYSTNEKIIGYWTDGKLLYRKVINYGTMPNNTQTGINHNISIDLAVRSYGVVYRQRDNQTFNIPFKDIDVWFDKDKVWISTGTDRSDCTAYVVIEYTKSS